jgi:nitrogen fixation protein FixH
VLATVGLVFAAWARRSRGGLNTRWLWAGVLTLFGVLLTVSLGSHAAAGQGRAWTVAMDLVHLGAAGVWLGGVATMAVALLFLLRRAHDTTSAARLVGHFSEVAAVSVFALAATGMFAALVQIPSWAALIDTSYGRTLLVKLALLAPLLAVAWANRWLHRRGGIGPVSRFVAIEASLGAVLIVSVAVLVQMPTPRPLATAPAAPVQAGGNEQAVRHTSQMSDFGLRLVIAPAATGQNSVQVELYHPGGGEISEVQEVVLRAAHAELGLATIPLAPTGAGLYSGQDVVFGLPGDWLIEVDVRRTGLDDVRVDLRADIEEAAAPLAGRATPAWGNPLRGKPLSSLVGVALLALGLAPIAWGQRLRRWSAAAARAGLVSGLAAATGGLVLIVTGVGIPSFSATPEDAFSPTIDLRYRTDAGRYVDLEIAPFRLGENTFHISVLDEEARPIAVAPVLVRFSQLVSGAEPAEVRAEPEADERFQAAQHTLARTGWWNIEVIVGDDERANFYLRLDERGQAPWEYAPPDYVADPQAEALFRRILAGFEGLSFVKWHEELTSGIPAPGGITSWILTEGEIAAPDRMHFRNFNATSLLIEQYWAGDTRCTSIAGRDDRWRCSAGTQANPLDRGYLAESTGFQLGRMEQVGGRTAQVLIFYTPWQGAWYSWWIDAETGQLLQRAMVATGHFMLTRYFDFDVPVDIVLPAADDS